MSTGRNDPCPCGSGKKYKRCCLAAGQQGPEALAWRRVRRALEGFPARMRDFVEATYGAGAIAEGWDEFTHWRDVPPDPGGPFAPVFWPWLFHHWSPDPQDTDVADAGLHDRSPTSVLLERQAHRLEPVLRQYLASCQSNAFSFFEVIDSRPGHGLTLEDVFTAEVHEVAERSASEFLREGDLTYGLLAQAQGVTLLEGCSPVTLPMIDKLEVIGLRQRLGPPGGIPAATVRDWDTEIRELYLALAGRALNPPAPQLTNTDGDPLVLQRMVFDIESAQEALDALAHLDFEATADEPADEVVRDRGGALVSATVTWKKRGNRVNKGWSNTVLGTLRIEGRRLTAEVNSDKRAAALRRLVERALGSRARFRAAEVQSAEKLLATARAAPVAPRPADDLAESPEVRKLLAEHMARHYDSWVRQKLPALGGRTPLAAMKDPVGREMVEALVRDIERRSEDAPQPVDEAIFRRLRERLGLPPA
jgi:hypothetical protein